MSGKVAVVTGAAQGMGAVTAKRLIQLGIKVALLDISEEALEKTTKTLQSEGGEVYSVTCDVTNKNQVFSAVENVKKHLGDIDYLVANAAIANVTDLTKAYVEKWVQVVDVNVIGVLHCVAAVLPDMMKKEQGHIVFMSSVMGRMSVPCLTSYSASKYFIQGYAAAIRRELAPLGIKVTCIQPGVVNTSLVIKNADAEVIENWKQLGVFNDIDSTMLHPEDVAEAIIYCLMQKDRVGLNQITLERLCTTLQNN